MIFLKSLNFQISKIPTVALVLAVPYVWALLCGLLFQFYIYPTFFEATYWGHGLVQGDWVFFHQKAIEFAQTSTWERFNFELVPLFLSPVYVLGVLYFVTGISEPWVFLPIGALIHSFSVFSLFLILRELKFSSRVSFLASLFYNVLPSSVILLSQFHRDGSVFLAYFLLILFLLKSIRAGISLQSFLLIVCSVLIMFLFRTYLLNFYFVVLLLLFPFLFYARKRALDFRSLLLLPVIFVCIYLGQQTGQMTTVAKVESVGSEREPASTESTGSNDVAWCVAENSFDRVFPASVRNQFCNLQTVRTRAVVNFPESVSRGYFEMFAYKDLRIDTPSRFFLSLPVILKIAYYEPVAFLRQFKSHWTLFNYVSFFETWLSFCLALVVFFSTFYRKHRLVLVPLLTSTFFLMLIAASTANMASFYRVKYGYSVMVSVIGVAFLLRLLFKETNTENS